MSSLIKKMRVGLVFGLGLLAAVSGNAATLTISTPSLVFPSQQIGTSSTLQTITLTAGGTVNFYALGIDSPNFSILLNNCGTSLASTSCTLQVKYNPVQAGTRSAELLIRSDATNTDYVPGGSCGTAPPASSLYYCVQYVYLQGTATGVPDAPTSVVATAGNAQATVTFSAPSDNGVPITLYTATANPGGATNTCTGPAACPITVTGLTNGTPYTFTVTATNGLGIGASAVSNQVTPKLGQTITFNPPAVNTFGTLTATATSLLPVTFTSSTGGVCTITLGGVLTPVAPGTCTITAAQAGNGTYSAATPVTQSYQITAGNSNVITFVATASVSMGTSPTLTATATSGLPVTFTSSTGGVCAITLGGVLTPASVGSCTITAAQGGNAIFNAAIPVPQTFSINTLTPQTITFAQPTDKNMLTSPVLTATTDATGLTATFTSSTGGVCTITPTGTLMPVSVGSCTITASQAGNGTYAAATPVSRTFNVLGAPQTITFAAPASVSMGASPTLTATSTSLLPVTFVSSTPAACTITLGGVLMPVATGTNNCTITASQVGNATYAAATPISQTFNIVAASSCPTPNTTVLPVVAWDWPSTPLLNGNYKLLPNQSLAIQFTASVDGSHGGASSVVYLPYPPADRYQTISSCPGDFSVVADGCVNNGNAQSASINFKVGGTHDFNVCSLVLGQTYYLNIRHANPGAVAGTLVETCSYATGCYFSNSASHN